MTGKPHGHYTYLLLLLTYVRHQSVRFVQHIPAAHSTVSDICGLLSHALLPRISHHLLNCVVLVRLQAAARQQRARFLPAVAK